MEFIYKIILLVIIIVILYIIINNKKESFYLMAEQGYIYNSTYDMYLMISNNTLSFTKNSNLATLFQLIPNGQYNYFICLDNNYIKLNVNIINNTKNYEISFIKNIQNNNLNSILQLSHQYMNLTEYGWLSLNSDGTYSFVDTTYTSTKFITKLL
jgi:hypothetical protein